jgi:HD superfamily phosphohydrolase
VPRLLLAAALLHDIGHYPFSHAVEELGYPIEHHEHVGRHLITTGEIAEVLTRHGLDPDAVATLIDPPRGHEYTGATRVLARLLSGALDVDKLDYLPRDARACNVPYGGVDVTRLLGALRVEGRDQLALDAKGISPLNSLLHARQEMFDNIYWHHTGRAMIIMLLRAVQEALLAEAIAPGDLVGHDDASLLTFLSAERLPEATRALIGGLRDRQGYKVVVELSSRAGRLYQQISALYWDAPKRRRAEQALAATLAEALGQPVPDWGILIDIPKPEKWEMDVTIIFDDPPLGMDRVMTWNEATGQSGDDLSRYEVHQRRMRILAAPELREAARPHRDALLAKLEQLAVL